VNSVVLSAHELAAFWPTRFCHLQRGTVPGGPINGRCCFQNLRQPRSYEGASDHTASKLLGLFQENFKKYSRDVDPESTGVAAA